MIYRVNHPLFVLSLTMLMLLFQRYGRREKTFIRKAWPDGKDNRNVLLRFLPPW